MVIKNKYVMFNRCINYMFKSILKTLRTYIYLLIVPAIILSLVYFLTYPAIIKNQRYILISSYVLLPIIFNIFLIGYIICEWRESVFLKQLNNFGINKLQFILSLLIVIFTVSFCSVFIIIGYLFVIDTIKNGHILQQWILEMTSFSQWFGLIFSITLNILVVFFIGLLISGAFKNIYLIQALNLLLVLVFIIFGDFFIDMKYSISSPIIILSYFVPQKYVTWINYIFYSQSDKYYYNFFKIIPSIDYKLSFTSIYQPVFSVLGFIGLFATSSYLAFLHGTKK